MLSTLRNAWKVPELKKRLLFLVFAVLIYRIGNSIPLAGVDPTKVANAAKTGLLSFYDLISGGAFSKSTIFAIGVIPYINASIIMQLLTIAIPYLEQLSKEGEDGRKKIQKYTRYATVPLAVLQAVSQYAIIRQLGSLTDTSNINMILIILTLTTGTVFLMWLGDKITQFGIGNGISLLIFINIMSRFPLQVSSVVTPAKNETVNIVQVVVFIVVILAMFLAVVISALAERRIQVQYAGKTVGNKTYRGQSTHIPININNSGVIAIIFAMSVLQFPPTLAKFWPKAPLSIWVESSKYSVFNDNTYLNVVTNLLLILFFTWFYTQITFKPDEMAENMHKSSGFIPGIRPGEPTAKYIEKVLGKISLFGGIFAGMIAVVPIIIGMRIPAFVNVQLGGTSLLIMVSVALETMRQIESQLVMRHYKGFLK
ncbi:MAG: preprotein translocase subunit SecY [Clostridiaceae bacterium]|nr:preprotein translocase subunit SecY [Clostridiaceae bacterium]